MRTVLTFLGAFLGTAVILLLDAVWLAVVFPLDLKSVTDILAFIYLVSFVRLAGGNGLVLFIATSYVLSKARHVEVAKKLPVGFALASLAACLIYTVILTVTWPTAMRFADSSLGAELLFTLVVTTIDGGLVGWAIREWFSAQFAVKSADDNSLNQGIQ